MPLSEEKKEELKDELPQVAVAGSSIRTKPGTDPDEVFADEEGAEKGSGSASDDRSGGGWLVFGTVLFVIGVLLGLSGVRVIELIGVSVSVLALGVVVCGGLLWVGD